MYSVVLMLALTAGAEAPSRCHGCHGCGGCWSSCGGGYCGGGCHGCHGGRGCHGYSSCGGCGGYSYGCGGCGGYYGGCGGYSSYGCGGGCGGYSSYGCGGGCGGYSSYGCGGYSSYGCGGGCGGYSSYGCGGYSSYGCGGGCGGGIPYSTPGIIYGTPAGSGSPAGSGTGGVGKEVKAPATIQVNVPEDAKLMIDDYATKSTSASRTLVTPELPKGQEFTYTLKVEVVREGKTVTDTKQIKVRAGETTNASFDLPAVSVATK